jgi:hypothetical protein
MSEETLPSVPEETPLDLKLDETALPADSRQIAAAKITDTLPAGAYAGAATLEINRDQERILDEPVPDNEIDIRPDGLIYVSHEYVRRQLNRAFGRLQWALVPGSPLVADGNEIYQRWVLLIQGTYVSEALGSKKYFANGNQSRDDVAEGIKSDCLKRCCKDLGIALEVWNKRRQESWRRQYATQVLVATSRGNEKQWRRADADPLKNEIPGSIVKPTEVVGDKGVLPSNETPATVPQAHVAPPPPSTPPPAAKPGPRAVPKAAPVKAAGPVVTVTDGQIQLLWRRARAAGLVVGEDAEQWITFLAENCMVPIPDRSGKKSTETAVAMMRTLPAGAHFQKLLKTLEIQANQSQVEI